ncbi:MAG: HAMP domain-containing sensor histidine kinase [bacterium]
MNHKLGIFISLCLAIIIIAEPWLILVLAPITIYLFNVLASLIFLLIIFTLSKRFINERLKKEIVSLTAHQLSSPLSSMKWFFEMLLNEDFGKISNEQREAIGRASKKNNQLIYLVNNLLNTSKIDGGKYLLSLKPSSITEVVLSVSRFLKDEIEKNKIEFEFIKPLKNIPDIIMDREKIRLAIQNLFDNAIKYTPAGGKVTVSLTARGKYIEFKIQDSGIGIEKGQKAKIFNKFFRGNNAAKHEPMGHGLGLFFVKSIIGAHNGKVWFKSKENEGSSFYFTLPIKK